MSKQSLSISKNENLHILEVVDNYFPMIDGVVAVVDNYAKQLNKKAHCTVLAPRYPHAPIPENYELIECFSVSGGKFGVRLPLPQIDLKLRKYLKSAHFDIIHCHSPVTLCSYIAKYAKKKGIPLVFTVHSKYHEEINAHVKIKFLQRFALGFLLKTIRKMDYFWAVSEGSRDMLINDYGIKVDCKIMRNGTDFDSSASSPEIVEKLKNKYSIAPSDLVLLTVGRLSPVKNFKMLIPVVRNLRDKGMIVKLIIVGFGECLRQLQDAVVEYGLADCVSFAGRIDDRTELASYFALSDLFLLPSTYDTSSLAIKEAYALSVPALCVTGSAAAEGIIDRHNGFIAENTIEAFTEKIAYVANNRDVLAEVSVNAHKELYTPWSRLIEDVYREYEKIVAASKNNEN